MDNFENVRVVLINAISCTRAVSFSQVLLDFDLYLFYSSFATGYSARFEVFHYLFPIVIINSDGFQESLEFLLSPSRIEIRFKFAYICKSFTFHKNRFHFSSQNLENILSTSIQTHFPTTSAVILVSQVLLFEDRGMTCKLTIRSGAIEELGDALVIPAVFSHCIYELKLLSVCPGKVSNLLNANTLFLRKLHKFLRGKDRGSSRNSVFLNGFRIFCVFCAKTLVSTLIQSLLRKAFLFSFFISLLNLTADGLFILI
jgi:hypothetical protein